MNPHLLRVTGLIALVAAAPLQAVAPPAKPCVSQPELRGMVAYMLPSLARSVVTRCQASLPADASLLTRGPQVAAALDNGRLAAYPMARRGFVKFSDEGNAFVTGLMLRMPEAQMRPIMEATVQQQLMGSFKVKDCADIDRVFATLQPLPADNFVDLVTQVLVVAGRDEKNFSVCAV